MTSTSKRPRISMDVPSELRRRIRLAAAKHDVSLSQYVAQAVEDRLRADLSAEDETILAMTARTDPLLAELWDNPRDAAYDAL